MSDLLDKKCVPCEGGVIPFDISEIHKYQKKVDGWDIIKDDENIFLLKKKFIFENFLKSQEFVSNVGKISEQAFCTMLVSMEPQGARMPHIAIHN